MVCACAGLFGPVGLWERSLSKARIMSGVTKSGSKLIMGQCVCVCVCVSLCGGGGG
jgi:hypothetical protein